ncbi:aspartyl-phosphate phosphatase Spo0E family protein (plasmid) [Paenibacillus sonchi]|uniref:Aspartyl-phosphate phosphatase Spo0E family protein n=1 Tax=Paenibacillus sonchi TaxID=373687 RepID=A0A974PJA1_9BACL|nr:aspartyl-phosphate phosphatase Spo0E family protein [Paenibacillus sonchi]QQZ64488.1 aspartyl-phosphate phosphatase Spo0E family protein [Paenibacillus sonchi]
MGLIHQNIERKRAELNRLAEKYGVSDRQVLIKSQELDRLLNEYEVKKDYYKRKKEVGSNRCEVGFSWRLRVCNKQ